MKNVNRFNLVIVFLPILILATYPIYKEGALAFALLSTILTGIIQVIFGVMMLIDESKNKFLQLYIALVVIYFLSAFFIADSITNVFAGFVFYACFAVLLAVYLSFIIYSKTSFSKSFLTAQWNDLAIINYEIEPKILEKYVPIGTEIDLFHDKCYISLIGFMFEDVRVLGFKIPFHINFEEVNLRFYVKRRENGIQKRGVVFIKEIVPKHAITIVANTLYKEHYQTLPMKHLRTQTNLTKSFEYFWQKNNKWQSIAMTTGKIPTAIAIDSEAEFITEHYFGYTKYNKTKTIEYEVTHPRWQQLEVQEYNVDVDFQAVYGNDFAFLQNLKPSSAFLAIGSTITIEGKKTIK